MFTHQSKRPRIAAIAFAGVLGGCAAHAGTGFLPQSGDPSIGPNATPAGTQSTVFVVSRDANAVVGFPRTSHGNRTPTVKIAGSATQLSEPDALAVDPNSGKLYVINDGGQGAASSEVLIFPKGANGNVTPKTISGSKVPIAYSEGVAIDASGEIYVSDYKASAIYVFPAGATGNTAPIRTIAGTNTLLNGPTGLAFDAGGNLWVTNPSSSTVHILKFAPTVNGNVAPIATIAGSRTKLGYYVFNVSIDPNGRIIAANSDSVEIFAAGAHGNVKPVATIAGSATTLSDVVSVGSDSAANVYVTNYDFNSLTSSIVAFGPHAHGNEAPLRVISGSHTDLSVPVYPSFY